MAPPSILPPSFLQREVQCCLSSAPFRLRVKGKESVAEKEKSSTQTARFGPTLGFFLLVALDSFNKAPELKNVGKTPGIPGKPFPK